HDFDALRAMGIGGKEANGVWPEDREVAIADRPPAIAVALIDVQPVACLSDKQLAVRAKGHGADNILMSEAREFESAGRLEHPRRVVSGPRRHQLAVRAEGHSHDIILMSEA